MIDIPDWVDHDLAAANGITPQWIDVLRYMAIGHTNAQIGAALHLPEDTVKSRITVMLRHMQARHRAEAVALAYDWGILRNAAMRAELHTWRTRLGVAS